MGVAPCVRGLALSAALSVCGLVGWRLWRAPQAAQAGGSAPSVIESGADDEQADGLVLSGFVQARTLDPRRWRIVATPLSLSAVDGVRSAELNTRGRFELTGLADMDHRVELVTDDQPPRVLARADYVRPGRDELVLELDPLQLERLADAALASE